MNEESIQNASQQSIAVTVAEEAPVGQRALSSKRLHSFAGYARTVLVTLLVALLLKAFVVEAFRIPSSSMEETLLVGDFLLVNKLAYGIRTPRYIPLTNLAIPTYYAPVFKSVERGDILVFEFPGSIDSPNVQNVQGEDEPVNYIKRCIGLPGDVVEIIRGQVYVNGNPVGLPRHARLNEYNAAGRHRSSTMFPWGFGFTEERYGPLVIPQKGDRIALTEENLGMWRLVIQREGHTVQLRGSDEILIDGKPSSSYTVEQNYYFVMGDNRDNSLDSRYWGFVPESNLIGEALFVYWSWNPAVPVSSVRDKLVSIRWNRIGTMIR
ncbi:MAG: signal peptidase I [Ignavibacteriae bacterium]|nr:signal peptidase I [Ignavibacteriota bacterium]